MSRCYDRGARVRFLEMSPGKPAASPQTFSPSEGQCIGLMAVFVPPDATTAEREAALRQFREECDTRQLMLRIELNMAELRTEQARDHENLGRGLEAVARGAHKLQGENELLRQEKDELEGQQAGKFFEFVTEVRKDDFWDFAMIMALGNRRKAAERLKLTERTFYERIEKWRTSDQKGYQKMVRLVEWRKAVGRTTKEALPAENGNAPANPDIAEQLLEVMDSADNLNYPALVQLIFKALQSQNRANWEKVRGRLMEILEEDVPQ